MGHSGIAGGGRYAQRIGSPGNHLLTSHAKERWFLEGIPVHGHGFPTRVLPGLSPLSNLFPADGLDCIRKDNGGGKPRTTGTRRDIKMAQLITLNRRG